MATPDLLTEEKIIHARLKPGGLRFIEQGTLCGCPKVRPIAWPLSVEWKRAWRRGRLRARIGAWARRSPLPPEATP